MNMKKVLSIALAGMMCLGLLAGCSNGTTTASTTPDDTASTAPTQEQTATLSGVVNTDGSTSMDSVMGVLGESFM